MQLFFKKQFLHPDVRGLETTLRYHSFDEVYGYPITAHGVNDPNPCDSENTVSVTGVTLSLLLLDPFSIFFP